MLTIATALALLLFACSSPRGLLRSEEQEREREVN